MKSTSFRFRRTLLLAGFGWIVFLLCADAGLAVQNPDEPTPLEAAKLPKYCQGQLNQKLRSIPGYAFPTNCGPLMNHFCYGLNFMNRADNFTLPKSQRQWNAGRARTDIDYTRKGMTQGCAIAGDVAAAEARLRMIERFVK